MSNEIFETLYKQYENMIKVFIRKYKGLIEDDEIRQACLIAIVKAHNSYNSDTNMKLSNWVYQNMQWEVYREIRNTKHLIKDCVSLQTPLNNSEDDNITLEDTLQDDIDVEAEIEDKIMINYYEKECKRVLPEDKFQVCYLKWFKGCSNAYIAEVTHRKYIHDVLLSSRSLILAKSRTLKEEYHKLHHIDDYSNTERVALLDS